MLQQSGQNVYTGCELLVKGALEGRVNFITGYPGSPIAEVFDIVESLSAELKKHGVLAQLANNEALGAARLNGTQMANLRAMAFMKSVGAHVAADALAISNIAGTKGGAVVVIGEDPHSDSTQVPVDSRYIAQHLFLPTLEPSTFQEVKDWIGIAFDLSAETNLYIAYIVTTHQADGGGVVSLAPHPPLDVTPERPLTLDPEAISKDDRIVLPPDTGRLEGDVARNRFPRLLARVREVGLNRLLYGDKRSPLAFVTAGAAYLYLQHALHELGAQGEIPILKLGMTYPLDPEAIAEVARRCEHLVVVEERRGLLESGVKAIVSDLARDGVLPHPPRVWGKRFPFGLEGLPDTLGLTPSTVLACLIPLFRRFEGAVPVDPNRLAAEEERLRFLERENPFEAVRLPVRTPGYCPGCPHRDSGVVLEQIVRDFADPDYMRRHHGTGPIQLVFHGDIGCYVMFKYEPFQHLMHNLAGMGLGGGGTGAGIDPFITNKQVVFMGDSTFFHSGIVGISDSIKHGQDITYIVLDNKTTAMTGHQTTPGLDRDLMGNKTVAQDIEHAIAGLVGSHDILLVRTDPSNHEAYRRLLEKTILQDGVKVIIADKECGITYHRRLRREKRRIVQELGYLPQERHINITPEVCEYCLECTQTTGCPALTIVDTDYGRKIETDRSTCVADMACTKRHVCPAFEEVIVERKAPSVPRDFPLEAMEEPTLPSFDDTFAIYAAGVGGMGIGVISAILVQAGHRQGYRVLFCDKKGLAIRNGSVFAHVLFSKSDAVLSPLIPWGKADVLLGMDALETARALDPRGRMRVGSPDRTRAVVNSSRTPTIPTLTGKDDFSVPELEEVIRRFTREGHYFSTDFFSHAERYFGNKLYANLMLLGAAYQKGYLPLTLDSLHWAIENSVPQSEVDANLKAFRLGRLSVAYPAHFGASEPQTYKDLLRDKMRLLVLSQRKRSVGEALAVEYQDLVQHCVERMNLDDEEHRHFALRVYDLVQYEDLDYAREYADWVLDVFLKDSPERGYRATKAVIRYLHKVMCIKDEVYVAHLLTSEEKRRRDFARYGVNPANGDSLHYVHINRPSFTLFGREIEFNWRSRDWQLRWMKRAKFLRRWLPDWHRREKEFRDWYIRLVERFHYTNDAEYETWVEILSVPETVRGYRQVRYPKMDAARKRVESLLERLPETPRSREEENKREKESAC